MLPGDRKPWAKMVAKLVIVVTVLGCAAYAVLVMQMRRLDTGEKAILFLLLLAVIPPNVAILRRKDTVAG